MEKLVVELCMGSSCFARGNSQTLLELENYLEDNNLKDAVELVGHLCLSSCSKGPNIKIGPVTYSGLDSLCVLDLVRKELIIRGWQR